MDSSSRGHRGSFSKKLGVSSYLLELVPDFQHVSDGMRHRMHMEGFASQYQFTTRPEDASRHELSASSHWSGRDSVHERDDPTHRFPPSAMTKCRLSRSKKRQPPTDPAVDTTPSKDHVIFAESPVVPGVPVVYRLPEERATNPDRLNLDRRHLTVCPIFEGEDKLRLLNMQHNSISKLQHLSSLRRLVFLDLYDNLIHELAGLEGLLSLRVLMLGKNRIRKITGLQTLVKLDVLDLHGNMVREIEGLSHLRHLRVLNLAGNDISCVANLSGLQALAELNLRRNRITSMYELDELPSLQRLFLSHNLIQTFDDICCLSSCDSLTDLTLDGNPLANLPDHRQSMIFHISHLRSLDQMLVSEVERSEALAAARAEEEHLKEMKKIAKMQDHKMAAIAAIRKAWESQKHDSSQSIVGLASTRSFVSSGSHRPRGSAHLLRSTSLPHLLPTYFVDHDGPCLHLYGNGALEMLDTPVQHKQEPVEEILFHFIDFVEITDWLPKLAHTYPHISSLTFECTDIAGLEQINALALLATPLHSLTITQWGNPITKHTLFRPYTLYRLHHLSLSKLNGETVTDEELVHAEQLFGRLGQLTTTKLTQARLLALVSKYRPRVTNRRSQSERDSLKRGSSSSMSHEPLNRVALHHFTSKSEKMDSAQLTRESVTHSFCQDLFSSALTSHAKRVAFDQLWPQVMERMVHRSLVEFAELDQQMEKLLDTL